MIWYDYETTSAGSVEESQKYSTGMILLKNYSTEIGNYYYRSKNWTFLQQWIEFNVKKVVVKI